MPANTNPIFPVAPTIGIATLTSPTPITSRANITGTTGLTQLTATSINGKRVDKIRVKAKATTTAGMLSIWEYDGTTSHLIYEMAISAVTPSTTVESFSTYVDFTDMVLPAAHQLYVSVTVANDLNIFAHGGDY